MKGKSGNKKFSVTASFIFLNFCLTLIIGLPYFKFVGGNPAEIFFTVVAYLSNTLMIYILLLAASFMFFFLGLPGGIFIVLFFAVNFLAVVDVGIYRVFRFHINGLVLNTLFTKGGWESLDFNSTTKVFVVVVFMVLLAGEFYLYNFLNKFFEKRRIIFTGKKVLSAVLMILVIIAADKLIYAYADLSNTRYITNHTKLFPLYQPLTVERFAQKYLKMKIDNPISFRVDKKYSGLRYPLKKLEFAKNQRRLPDIILILSDSFRYDMLSKDITPNIYEFGKRSLVFNDHYSGGNCTRFGVFSLFYGLCGYYWNSILGERQPPVIMTALINSGYDFQILAATELTFPEFTKTCFVEIPKEKIFDTPKAADKSEKDAMIADELIKYIDRKSGASPFFSFIFFDCPHGSYDSPAGFHKFKPAAETFNYLTLNKDNIAPVFNRYKNSLYYDDYLIGRIIKKLEKTGRLNNTVVIISGDHGEAFLEKGYYGHNRGFCTEQVKVPFVVYIPGCKHRVFDKLTCHQDLVPTLLNILGCKNPPGDYCQGVSLLEDGKREFIANSTWDEMAAIDDKYTVVIPFESYNIPRVRMYDNGTYKEITDKKITLTLSRRLLKVQKEITYFVK